MGLFGGLVDALFGGGDSSSSSSSSANTSTTTTTTTVANTDSRQWWQVDNSQPLNLAAGAIYSGGPVNVVDGGAIALAERTAAGSQSVAVKGFDLAEALTRLVGQQSTATQAAAFGVADSAIASAQALAGRSFDASARQAQFLADVLARSLQSQGQVNSLVADAYNDAKGRGAQTDRLVLVAVGGAVLVAALALRK